MDSYIEIDWQRRPDMSISGGEQDRKSWLLAAGGVSLACWGRQRQASPSPARDARHRLEKLWLGGLLRLPRRLVSYFLLAGAQIVGTSLFSEVKVGRDFCSSGACQTLVFASSWDLGIFALPALPRLFLRPRSMSFFLADGDAYIFPPFLHSSVVSCRP